MVPLPEDTAGRTASRRAGVAGQLLIAAYTVLAVAAGARAAVQIATRFDDAPIAYVLSAGAAAVYLLAAVALRRPGEPARLTARAACTVELVGVLLVGSWSVLDPTRFPDATVWSAYGSGYGFVPLVLPVLGLRWLRRRPQA